jgi:N-dimethylarginine dimethylaminohydrolase
MRILTCPPDYFGVDYVINPWMEGQIGCVEPNRARAQWDALFADVSRSASVMQVAPVEGSPDMCFTANAALVENGRAVPARFRMSERRGEERPFASWFRDHSFVVEPLPETDPFEGEGDALFQPERALLWAGYGVRTALKTHIALAQTFDVEVVSLRLIDQRFYHLDTCFAPLPGGRLMYYPAAFDARSRDEIEARIPSAARLEVSDADAMGFACNALRVGDRLFMNSASDALVRGLAGWGFEARIHPVDEFLKAGGGVKCLSLLLDQPERTHIANLPPSPIRTAQVELAGHLLDDGLLRRALDLVTEHSGSFRVDRLDLAERKDQTSRTSLHLVGPSEQHLDDIVAGLEELGATQITLDGSN